MQAGGPSYQVELGRLDGLSSTSSSVNGKLPQPTFNVNQLNSLFSANGLTQADMVALSGTYLHSPIIMGSVRFWVNYNAEPRRVLKLESGTVAN